MPTLHKVLWNLCQSSDPACDKKTSKGCGLDFACGFIFICEVFSYPRNQVLPNRYQAARPPTLARMHAILPCFTFSWKSFKRKGRERWKWELKVICLSPLLILRPSFSKPSISGMVTDINRKKMWFGQMNLGNGFDQVTEVFSSCRAGTSIC